MIEKLEVDENDPVERQHDQDAKRENANFQNRVGTPCRIWKLANGDNRKALGARKWPVTCDFSVRLY
jgi:hypothetical protein